MQRTFVGTRLAPGELATVHDLANKRYAGNVAAALRAIVRSAQMDNGHAHNYYPYPAKQSDVKQGGTNE